MISTSLLPILHTLAEFAPAGQGAQPNPIFQFMPLLFIGVIFYFLLIRPQQKRAKDHVKLVAAIQSGDRVVTNSGIHGIIANVKDTTFLLKVADNVKLEISKDAIATVLKPTDNAA